MATVTMPLPQILGVAGVPQFPAGAKAITKSDTDIFDRPVAIYVGVAGNVVVAPANGGSDVTFVGVPAGTTLPVMVTAVRSTNTTASSLVAVY